MYELIIDLWKIYLHFLRELVFLNKDSTFIFAHVVLDNRFTSGVDSDLLAFATSMHLSELKGALVNVDGKVLIHFLIEHTFTVELPILKLPKVPEPAIILNKDTVLLTGQKRTTACRGIELIVFPWSGIKVTVVEEALTDGSVPHIILKLPYVFIKIILRVGIGSIRITYAVFDELTDSVLLTFRFFLLLFFARVNLLLILWQLPDLSIEKVTVLIFNDVENIQLRV